MHAHHLASRYEQLVLPLAAGEPTDLLATSTDTLIALHGALRFVLDVADGHTQPNPATVEQLHASLDVLATFHAGGRLGRVVRHFRNQPSTPASWTEFVDELAFVIGLYPGEPTR